MLQTGERVARRHGISTAEQNAVTLRRYEQYAQACADERAFQRRYMTLPFELPDAAFAKTVGALQGDEGIHATTAEGLARLTPVLPDGSITYGGQTHPADGSAGMLMTTAAARANCRVGPRSASRCWPSASRARKPATCRRPHRGRPARAGPGRAQARRPARGQDAQPLRGVRHRAGPRHRPGRHGDEQLRLLAGLGPSAGADRPALGHRTDRGTGAARRRAGPVHRPRRRRQRDGGGAARGRGRRPAANGVLPARIALIPELLERAAADWPDRTALVCGERRIDYRRYAAEVARRRDACDRRCRRARAWPPC